MGLAIGFVEHGMSATYGLERNWMKPTTLFSNPCQMQHQKWAAHEKKQHYTTEKN
ncbi:hypothetical protein Hanom_Chr06g00499721 [Helianthus anomalus]